MKSWKSTSAQYDLSYLKAGVEKLEEYLMSPDIFQPIGITASIGETPFPQLTLGVLLLTQKRAQAIIKLPSEKDEWHRLNQELETSHTRWKVAWVKKANAEFQQQLNLWSRFLEEYDKDPEANYDRYGYEIRRRTILQILSEESEYLGKEVEESLADLDRLLKSVFIPGEFVWDSAYSSSFPRMPYWYLYGRIRVNV